MFTALRNLRDRRRRKLVERINAAEPALQTLSDAELRSASLALRYRARSGESAARLTPDAFPLVREAARRTIGMGPTPMPRRPAPRRLPCRRRSRPPQPPPQHPHLRPP